MAAAAFESFVLPALAGSSFSLIAVAYRMGQPRSIPPIQMLGVAAVAGAAVFAALFCKTGLHLSDVPAQVWLWGILGGLGQYVTVKLFATALRLGPLSPLWCVVSLAFIPTLAYSGLFLSETLLPLQYVAIATSALCVIVASARSAPGDDPSSADSPQRPGKFGNLLYLAVLAAVLLTNSLLAIGQRSLGAMKHVYNQAALTGYGHFLLVLVYLVLVICVAADVMRSQGQKGPWKTSVLLGLLLAVGSMAGLGLLNACSSSAIVFAVAGITQIIIVAVISVIAFGERTTAGWYGTILLGVLSVALANWGAITAAR